MKDGLMRYILYVFWILIVFLGTTFAALNPQKIVFNYCLDIKTIYLPLLIFLALLVGAILGIIALLPSWIKNKNTVRRLKYKVKRIEQEVRNFRTFPIKDVH
ncbi:MAG: lipopolysaccharide assembly protein LapA domain-containing protein [Coxiella endosymbiont of Haemaphysalis qinghaiensis]